MLLAPEPVACGQPYSCADDPRGLRTVSEIYGSGGGYDRGDSQGNDVADPHDSWDS